MNPETRIQNLIMVKLSEAGCTVWRNETKRAWVGQTIHKAGDQVTLSNARMILLGLCVGSADLIVICPDGKFGAIEVKTKTGRPSAEQVKFIDAVTAAGGRAGIARNTQDALNIINQ